MKRLIAGPPCGGKSTYVLDQAEPADVVLDFDDIVEELGGDRYSLDARVRQQAQLEFRRRLPAAHWVIWTAPRRAQRARFQSQWNAAVVVVMADPAECLRRAELARPPQWQQLVRRWFAEWQPGVRERIVNTTELSDA